MSDIWGSFSGRHQVVADMFASHGYNVYMPEFLCPPYVGEMDIPAIMANIGSQNVELMEQKFVKLLGLLKKQGVEKFVSLGFCWGVWFAFRMAAKYDCFKAIVGAHPSIALETFVYKGSEVQLAEKICCPAYLMPASNDMANVKEKGEVIEVLEKRFGADRVGATEFPDMMHGWVVRGDLKDEKVNRDFHKCIALVEDYFKKFE